MSEIHIFDLDSTLWETNSYVWVINKENPSKPIVKISQQEMELINTGIYKKDNILIDYNDKRYFISKDLHNKIQKKRRIPIDKLGLSFTEFTTKNKIDESDLKFITHNIIHLSHKSHSIILLTGRSNRSLHESLLNKLRLELKKLGIDIYKIYFINDATTYNRYVNETAENKTRILLEHLIGLKINDDRFIAIKQDPFETIHFYDDDLNNMNYANNIQAYLEDVTRNTTNDELFEMVIDRIRDKNLILKNHLVSNNLTNRFKTTEVKLVLPTKYPIKISESHIKKFNQF